MSPDEAAEFWDGEPITFGATPTIKPANDYPAAIRSFVGTVQALAAVERERDEARAEVERLRGFIRSELDGICLNGEGAFEAFDRRDRHRAALGVDS